MLDADNSVIQSLWIGSRLSTMEQLSICSFLKNGHTFHLYTYDFLAELPPGTKVIDAGQILPRSLIFRYSGSGSFAGFSNFFRYKLLLDRGGWWVDLDTICLRPFAFDEEYVFSSEIHAGEEVIDAAAIKAPRGSELAEYAWGVCKSKDPKKLVWGETGPKLLGEAVKRCGLRRYVRNAATFCPIPFREWESVLDPNSYRELGPDVFAVHLWNEMWRDSGRDKDSSYSPGCLYERLKSRYLGSNR
ncbi:MAG TPA: glycosyltransferase [Candidatus Angelobacter sp.]|nr:glycosyltransferase [Candidatus Angelobacter sp.]